MQKSSRFIVLFAALTLLFAGFAQAQTFGTNPNPPVGPSGPSEGDGGACGTVTISQSASTTPVALNSVSCNAGGLHADNSYYRAFDLAGEFGITEDFDVCEVNVGIEVATAGTGGVQPMTVNIYAGPVGFPTGFPGSYTLIGTTDVDVADQALTLLAVPVAGTVPAGSELVVEAFTPDGQAVGHSLFIGSNAAGETGPSYIAAAACSITTPTATGAIGFPQMQIILEAVGDTAVVAPATPIIEVPTASHYGLAGLIAILAILGAVVIRRRLA